jgi:uncharacterized protein
VPQRYFFDTSALIARYLVRAAGHAWVEQLRDPANQNSMALAEVTGAELAAALFQLARGNTIRRRLAENAVAHYWREIDSDAYHVVPISGAIVRRAADLCAVHALRGYDAVQLACALTFRDDARAADALPSTQTPLGDPIFITEDRRLMAAASAEGFPVDTPLAHQSP